MDGYIARIMTSFIEIPGMICSSVYFTGCTFNCVGCQNTELQNIHNGKLTSVIDIVNSVNNNELTKWVCFLGGEPFYQPNFLFSLCSQISKPIGIYTGYDYESVIVKFSHILSLPNVHFLKTGKFIPTLINDIEYPITSNQHIYLKFNNCWNLCSSRNIREVTTKIITLYTS
jgi:anaerobic ribonucleoside-triphosphate reductase activating protein